MYAVKHGKVDHVELLLARGAERTPVDNYGQTAADMARKRGVKSIQDALET
jgi:ankyrin repeat protein